MEELNEQPIKCFYKYRPLSDKKNKDEINEHTLALLTKGELYFSRPSEFNDPFDSEIRFNMEINEGDISAICKRKGLSLTESNKIIEKYRMSPNSLDKVLESNKQMKALKLFCVSKEEKNILMWSHYGAKHTGICVGIKTYFWGKVNNIIIRNGFVYPNFFTKRPQNLLTPLPVKYTNDVPEKYNIGECNQRALLQSVLYKATDWHYEKEYRIVLWDDVIINNPICISTSEISEIIFGLNASDKLINKVRGIVKTYPDNGSGTTLYKCVKVEGKYAIDKVEIPK